MSGYANISAFPENKLLFDAASGQATADVQNALYRGQEHQQVIGGNETEMIARAASALRREPDLAKRATLYPLIVGGLQANGFAKNAPAALPDDSHLAALESMGTPSTEQYKLGQQRAGNEIAYPSGASAAPAPGTVQPAAAGAYGRGGPGGSLTVPAEYMPFYKEASDRTGIPVDVLIAQHRQESGFNPNATGAAGEIGIGQVAPATARNPGYGMTGVEPATLRDPRTNINFSADYLKARAGGGNMADPEAQRRALLAYNGGGDPNYVANVTRYLPAPGGQQQATAAPVAPAGVAARTGGVDVAGPSAVPPGTSTADIVGPRPLPPTGPGSPVATPASIANTPAPAAPVVTAQAPAPAPQPQAAAPAPLAPPGAPVLGFGPGGQYTEQQDRQVRAEKMRGGDIAPLIDKFQIENRAALLQAYKLAHPELKQVTSGGEIINLNPTTGEEVGPRIKVTPNTRGTPLPAVRNGVVGTQLWTPAGPVPGGFEALPTRPAHGGYDLQKGDYDQDRKELPGIADAGQQAQSSQIRLQQMRELASKLSTGAGGNTRAGWANIAETLGFPNVAKMLVSNPTGAGDAAAAQEFAKMTLLSAGGQERSVLGARGGYQAMQLFKAANPGLDLRPDANRKILNMQLIGAQADADYAHGALTFANDAGDAFRGDKAPYVPLTHFDQVWQEQRNPQIYAAAIGAINGDSFDKWTKALNTKSPDDVRRVLDVVRRADPTSAVLWSDGQPHAVGQ